MLGLADQSHRELPSFCDGLHMRRPGGRRPGILSLQLRLLTPNGQDGSAISFNCLAIAQADVRLSRAILA